MIRRALAWAGLERRNAPSPAEVPAVGDFGTVYRALRSAEVRGGVAVTPETAQGVAAVFAAVQLLAEAVASVPLHLYRRLPDGGRERDRAHPLAALIDRPAADLTQYEFTEGLVAACALSGTGYAEIVSDPGTGRIDELRPLPPSRIEPHRLRSGRVVFHVSGDELGPRRTLLADEVLAVRYRLAADGLRGLSPIAVCRSPVAAALAEQTFHHASFANGTKPGGVLETDRVMSEPVYERMRAQWNEAYAGPMNAGKTVILEEGLKFNKLSLSNEDQQFVETRKFSVEEIARIYRVPPFLIGSLDNANYANSREAMRLFTTLTLRAWTRRIEQALERALFSEQMRATHFLEFQLAELLRGTEKERAEVYATAITAGWLTPDEVRGFENLPPRRAAAGGSADG